MAVLTIRNIDDAIKTGLRVRAAQHGCSMEEEVRRILIEVVSGGNANEGLDTRIHRHFAGLGELEIPPRNPVRPPTNVRCARGEVEMIVLDPHEPSATMRPKLVQQVMARMDGLRAYQAIVLGLEIVNPWDFAS